ncbi:GNAT family N-acetyltransferase [Aestuariivirga sp.]|uniref:GNAT family N-acetyltransferase n=1 Tax=Aestuariivirga sp. TaxID=2650926 RepID=UPI0039E4D6DA
MPPGFSIRRYRPSDAADLARIFEHSVKGLASRHYTAGQVAAWLSDAPDENSIAEENEDGQVFLAVTQDDHAVAYIDLEPDGHIDMLFCLPEFAGRGIGSALCREAELAAREASLQRLFVEASESAKPAFERNGFRIVARNDFEINSVAIHNYRMEKFLR